MARSAIPGKMINSMFIALSFRAETVSDTLTIDFSNLRIPTQIAMNHARGRITFSTSRHDRFESESQGKPRASQG